MFSTSRTWNGGAALWLAGVLVLGAGCTPPGPRALLEGGKLLEAGKYPEAVERLKVAASLLETNAVAWNYLGLAHHHAGEAQLAAPAYERAISFDRDLFVAHFNLGCLWLEQGKLDAAKSRFTACTLRQPDSLSAWLKLGTAQRRLGEIAAAEESFKRALRLGANHPEALNGLGLVSAQRRRSREAAQYFEAALKQQPDYAAARLNLATVLWRDIGDLPGALRNFREYLASSPPAPEAAEVKRLLESLEPKPVVATVVKTQPPATNAPAPNVAKPAPVVQTPPTPTKSNPSPPSAKPSPPPVVARVETVELPPEPVIRTTPAPASAPDPAVTSPATSALPLEATASAPVEPVINGASVSNAPKRRGFLARLNPFRGGGKPSATNVVVASGTDSAPTRAEAAEALRSFPRYQYRSPAPPSAGDRAAADAAMERGRQAEQGGKQSQAVAAYRQAVRTDPAYFEAQYHLALAHFAQREFAAALSAWENALALQPDSLDARYNFALTMKAAGYALDAAAELDKILAARPGDARAHLLLGNLCAEQLRDKPRARVHYQRILELSPGHPQAPSIRYWLVANPG